MTTLNWLPAPDAPNPNNAEEFVIEPSAGDATVRKITGALWLPELLAESLPQSLPLVLLGHGASGDRYQAPLPYLAKRFTQEFGFAVLAIDGPVHGLRQVGDGGRSAFFKEMQREGFVDDMVQDWQLALQHVCANRGIDVGPLGYFGLSMGTMFGLPLLASTLDFSVATIGLCGVTGAAAGIGQRLARDAHAVDHPILFLMQLEDELFDRTGYLSLFDALGSGDKCLHANPGLHPDVPAHEMSFAVDFIAARLAAGHGSNATGAS